MTARGLNQIQMAASSGLTQASISRWLNGVTEPKISDVVALARSLGMTVSQILGEGGQLQRMTMDSLPSRREVERLKREIHRLREVLDDILKKF